MIPATPEPKIPENGPEPEFRPEFFRNFETRLLLIEAPVGARVEMILYLLSRVPFLLSACLDE
jgi:hypothetical protein